MKCSRTPIASVLSGSAAVLSLVVTFLVLAVPAQMDNQNNVDYQKKKFPDGSKQCIDKDFGVLFRLPPHWRLVASSRWVDPGWQSSGLPEVTKGNPATTVSMTDKESRTLVNLYYARFVDVHPSSLEETDKKLMADVDDKLSQRRDGQHLAGYRMRSKSYEPREIAGHRALACVAEFRRGNARLIEYFVWVRSDKSLAQFFVKADADQLDTVREVVDPIAQSLRIP